MPSEKSGEAMPGENPSTGDMSRSGGFAAMK
jgi:hypothetical protein